LAILFNPKIALRQLGASLMITFGVSLSNTDGIGATLVLALIAWQRGWFGSHGDGDTPLRPLLAKPTTRQQP